MEGGDGTDLVVVDCATAELYGRAHIRGAQHVGVAASIKSARDRQKVMQAEEFEALMALLGVGPRTDVVVYDANALSATRLWWAMQYHGHESVRLLAGGWHRWVEEGRPVEATPPVVGSRAAEPFVSQPRSAHIALAGDVLDVIRDSQELPAGSSGRKRKPQLVDVRTRLEYEGLDARGNPRAGRIPGSVHLDHAALLSPERRTFKALDEMAAVVDQVGLHRDKPVLVYCQAGIRAANTAFALRLLGFDDVAVFDGSMAEWLADDSLPLESETPADGPGSGGLGDA